MSGRGLDVFSDCIALTMGLGDTDGGLATTWLRSPTLGSCDGAIESIRAYDAGQGLSGGYEYFRYWHGYTVVSRPLVATIGVTGTRIVLFWAFARCASAGFARRLWRFHGAVAPVALLGPFLLTSDTVELARSLPHGLPAARRGRWRVGGPSGRSRVIARPRASAGHRVERPATGDGRIRGRRDLRVRRSADDAARGVGARRLRGRCSRRPTGSTGRGLAARGAIAGAAWIVGWVWTWVSKWVIAAAVLGVDRVRDSIGDAVDDRIAGERDYIDLAPFNAIRLNVETWLDHPLTPVGPRRRSSSPRR